MRDRPAPLACLEAEQILPEIFLLLVREAEILLYALIVAGPLLLVGLGAVAFGRMQRRRFEDRVLERT